jgi:hypothetical protein
MREKGERTFRQKTIGNTGLALLKKEKKVKVITVPPYCLEPGFRPQHGKNK